MDFHMVKITMFSAMLFVAAWQDLRQKTIDMRILLWGAGTALLLSFGGGGGSALSLAAGSIPGIFLLIGGRLTAGEIGSGDGWFFLVSGWYLGIQGVAVLLCGAIFLCGIWALAYLFWKQVSQNKSVRKDTLPFLPFAVPIWVGMLAAGGK